MNTTVDHLLDTIEKKRVELNKLIENSFIKGKVLINNDVIKKSEELDILLVQYYRLENV